jgi:hypothetical protein
MSLPLAAKPKKLVAKTHSPRRAATAKFLKPFALMLLWLLLPTKAESES